MNFKATACIALGCMSLTVAAQSTSVDTLTLSLDQCLEIALNDNPTIKVADMEIQRVDYAKKETIGQLLPTISFGANYNRMVAKQVAYMNMDNFPGMEAEKKSAVRLKHRRPLGRKARETMESKWVLTTVIRQDSTRRFL